MAFPSSPTNGQVYTQNGTSYIYDSTYGVWNINTTSINADSLDGIDSTGFLGATAKASDSNLLDGIDSTGFLRNGSYSGAQKLFVNRNNATANGISWYSTGYTAWCEYMSPAGAASTGPTGNITAPSGSLVTSWGLRSFIENASGYGWTWESGSSSQTTPSVKFEIRSSDGSIYSQGSGTFAGVVTANSDVRLKSNIRPIQNALSIVSSLNGRLYTKDDKDNQIGLIAQEVEEVLPQMVHTADDEMGTKSVNYQNMVAILIESVKEQQKQIEDLRAEVSALKGV